MTTNRVSESAPSEEAKAIKAAHDRLRTALGTEQEEQAKSDLRALVDAIAAQRMEMP